MFEMCLSMQYGKLLAGPNGKLYTYICLVSWKTKLTCVQFSFPQNAPCKTEKKLDI